MYRCIPWAALWLLFGCGQNESQRATSNPILEASPSSFLALESDTERGKLALGLGGERDGFVYVPSTYTSENPSALWVMLHGASGSANRSWGPLVEQAEARNLLLLVPDSRQGTWDGIRGRLERDRNFIELALQQTFERYRVDPARVVLAGFSDGASYALALGRSNGELFRSIVAFSPGFARRFEPVQGKPRVFVSHGRADSVLPVGLSRDTIVPEFRAAGYDVTYDEFDGDHELPPAIRDRALEWFFEGP